MKRFSIRLTEDQYTFLQSNLPSGICLKKAKGKPIKPNNESNDDYSSKNDTLLQQNSGQSPFQDLQTNLQSGKDRVTQKKGKQVKNKENTKQKSVSLQTYVKRGLKEATKLYKLILDQLEKKKSSSLFIQPVDPVKLRIPTYFTIIKQPMDLQTMRNKLGDNQYSNLKQFENDLEKTVWNCLTFNSENDYIIKIAQKFEKDYKSVLQKYRNKLQQLQKKDSFSQKISESMNSQQLTNSQGQILGKIQKKSNKVKIKQNKRQQNQLKQKQTEGPKTKGQPPQIPSEYDLIQSKKQQRKEPIQQTKTSQSRESQMNESFQPPKHQQKPKKSPKTKKYSLDQRLSLIQRIRQLKKTIMAQFFRQINFSKGQALDFKLLEDQKIHQIQIRLKTFEQAQEADNLAETRRENKQKSKQINEDFQIAQDRDYDD